MDTTNAVAQTTKSPIVLGFFTALLILTLNDESGRDVLDTLVPYIDAHTQVLLGSIK